MAAGVAREAGERTDIEEELKGVSSHESHSANMKFVFQHS